MSSILRTAPPLLAALLLLGQGPLCQLLCAPDATGHDAGPMAAISHDAMPPCHGGEPAPARDSGAPERSEHECASCDQIARSAVSIAKDATSQGVLLVVSATAYAPAPAPIATARFAPPDDRAPPGHGRALLLRKSSLLL